MSSLIMNRLPGRIVSLLVTLVFGVGSVRADASLWNQFRGPGGAGVALGCRPPIKLASTHLAWKISVPSGFSSPVLSRERIFVTGIEEGRLVTLAFDKKSGDLAWRRKAPKVPLEKAHKANGPATPTPYVDEERIYVYFGSYGLLCYDHEGSEKWVKPIAASRSLYGTATSPIVQGDLLILVLDNDANLPESKLSQSKILALRKSTGEVVWETPRPFLRSGWSTPMIWAYDGGLDLVVLGSGRVCGYNPVTGAEKWFATGFSRETISTPVAGNGLVYVSSSQLGGGADEKIDPEPFWKAVMQFDLNGDEKLETGEMTGHFTFPIRPELPLGHPGFGIPLPEDEARRKDRLDGIFSSVDKNKDGFWIKKEFVAHMSFRRGKPRLMAIKPGGAGDVEESHVAWQLHRSIPEIPSPLFYGNRIYMVRNGGILAAVNAGDGKIIYRKRLDGPGQYSASPVMANGHLYLVSNEGLVSVVKAGDSFERVHQHDLEGPGYACPAIDATTIYFRTGNDLRAYRSQPD